MTRVDVISNERAFDDRHHLHEFADFWRDTAVALIFLPQFGSAFALSQARELALHQEEIRQQGARLVVVGLGSSVAGFTFRQRSGLRDPVIVTQDETIYRTMGLGRASLTLGAAANTAAFAAALRRRDLPYQRTGDPRRLGGIFVVPAGGTTVSWEHRQRLISDIVPGQRVRNALIDAATPSCDTATI